MKQTFESELEALLVKYADDPESPVFNLVVPVEQVAVHVSQSVRFFIIQEVKKVLDESKEEIEETPKQLSLKDIIDIATGELRDRIKHRQMVKNQPMRTLIFSIHDGDIYIDESKLMRCDNDDFVVKSNN